MLKKSLLKHFYSIEQNQNYKYPIISTENIYYSDSIPKVILKYGLRSELRNRIIKFIYFIISSYLE